MSKEHTDQINQRRSPIKALYVKRNSGAIVNSRLLPRVKTGVLREEGSLTGKRNISTVACDATVDQAE